MKLVHYVGHGRPHAKNDQALPRMCAVGQVEYEETTDTKRLLASDYDILVSCTTFLNPQHIPSHVKIVFGPHFSVFPEGPLVGAPNPEWSTRCVYNCLSEWNRDVFREMAPLTMPLVCLPFGVDLGTFAPTGEPKSTEWDCLVYVKRRPTELVQHVLEILATQQLKWRVFQYGSYKEEEYRAALCRTKWLLVLDAHESQGFALQEAMACNVPLLVVDATSMYDETEGGRYTYAHLRPRRLAATSVPYWSDECGIRCGANVGEAVKMMQNEWTRFAPREYIRRTLSYEVCMQRMLDILGLVAKN